VLTVSFPRLGLEPGDRVLDLGCGAGRHAYEAMRLGAHVVAYDVDAAAVKDTATVMEAMDCDGTGAAVNGDALQLPFGDGAFDRVIAAEVLEHIVADTVVIAELARVLRPGGVLAVTVPRWGPELANWALSDEYHTVPGGHLRIYRASALTERIEAAGLSVFGRGYAHGLHAPYWWLRCLVGVGNESHPLVRAYHQVLCWDIEHRPFPTRALDAALTPVIGKSLVLYARRPGDER
jgi:SAM-dependent methyltransferase